MLMLPPNTRIFISVDRVDMRRSIDGLSVLVQDVLQQNPLSGHLFVFANKSGNGFCLWYKRLERHRFRLPKISGKSYCVSVAELGMILEGIDLIEQRRLETLEYDKIN
jgi:transposase